MEQCTPGRPSDFRERVKDILVARQYKGCDKEGAGATDPITYVRKHMIESAVVVYGQRTKGCIVDAIPIGRQALTPTRAARRGIGTDGLHADVGNDLNGCGPVRGVGAVSASRALDHQVLVQTQD